MPSKRRTRAKIEKSTPTPVDETPGSPRGKLREGLVKIVGATAVGDPEAARKLIQEGWPTSVDKFLRWVQVGNDQLYGRHVDLKDAVAKALDQFKVLAQSEKKPTRRNNELRAAKERVAYLEHMVDGLLKDVMDMSSERDKLRRDHAFESARANLYETALLKHNVQLPKADVGLVVVNSSNSGSVTKFVRPDRTWR